MSSGLDRCISCKKLLNQCICKDSYEKFMDGSHEIIRDAILKEKIKENPRCPKCKSSYCGCEKFYNEFKNKNIENYSKCGIYSEAEIFEYDDRPKLYMMIGMPGSGKSTYIQKHLSNIPVICKDMMRLDIFRQEYDQANEIHISRISKYLSDILADNKVSFILDETSLKSMRREKIIELYKDRMYIVGIWICAPFEKCKKRRLHFPEGIMEQKWEEFEHPIIGEGFDELITIDNIDDIYYQRSKINENTWIVVD